MGSEGDKFSDGIIGKGIDKNFQDCYRFFLHNYELGDAFYLIGFSRGAYTPSSLAGLIRNCGILRGEHAEKVSMHMFFTETVGWLLDSVGRALPCSAKIMRWPM